MKNEKLYFKVLRELTDKQELSIKRRFNELFRVEGLAEVCDIVADIIFYNLDGWEYVSRKEILEFLKDSKGFIKQKEKDILEGLISDYL